MAFSGIVPPTTITTSTPSASARSNRSEPGTTISIPGNMATGNLEVPAEAPVNTIPKPQGKNPKSPKAPPAKTPKSPAVTVRAAPTKPMPKPASKPVKVAPIVEAPPPPPPAESVKGGDIVEVQLSRVGYTPVSRIITKGEKGPVAHYIKAVNRRGQTVYIYLDARGNVAVRDNDEILAESSTASSIPLSLKSGAFRCAGLQVAGIALECKNGVCTITRDEKSVNPVEQNYIVQPDETDENNLTLMADSPVAYPVVRLSEIVADPATVESYTESSTRQLQNDLYNCTQVELNRLGDVLGQLNESFDYFMDLQSSIFTQTVGQIQRSRNVGSALKKDLPSHPGQPHPGQPPSIQPIQNAAYYENRLNEMIRICSSISDIAPALAAVRERIAALIRFIESSK